jgi:hypothetical protein
MKPTQTVERAGDSERNSLSDERPTPGDDPRQPAGDKRRLSRREFIPRAAGGVLALGVAGAVGYELHSGSSPKPVPKPSPSPAPEGAAAGVQSFFSRPDLQPPAVRVTNIDLASATSSPRFIFLSPRNGGPGGPIQQGLMILDRRGRLVYFQPVSGASDFDLSVQPYRGQQVLAWWQGAVQSAHGYGVGELAGANYQRLQTIHAGDGLQTDLHELNITSKGTALITAYETTTADLTKIGGSQKSRVFIGHAQEIDLNTGKVLLDWDSSKFVPFAESLERVRPGNSAFDYFHINSVSEMDDGNLLISGRNTWALYKVDRSSGEIIWRLNGKKSDFSVDRSAQFYWQHHARSHGSDVITLFDNAVRKEKQSRGLVLSLDAGAKRVSLQHAYVHPAGLDSTALGSVELQSDGRVFVGWGDQPYFSEFAADGTLLLDGQLPSGILSYRALVLDWVGTPPDSPRIAARAEPGGGFVVYASWNGATEIARWSVLAGKNKTSLATVGSQEWAGFETAIAVNSEGPYFQAVALDSGGKELGRSDVA